MADQLDLFSEGACPEGGDPLRPDHFGGAAISYSPVSSILSKATGFVGAYDYTLNPYSGCAFGCSYCYAAFFARDRHLQDTWGHWVRVKEDAVERLRRRRPGAIAGKRIYMSSVTDPYQPIEAKLELTRSLLRELVRHQPRMVIQTRSPLAERDIDLFREFTFLQVNMTVTTDDEEVRRAFEPLCPSNDRRLAAIARIADAGIATAITMTPLLPVRDPEAFAERLLATGAGKFVVQPFHASRGNRFVAGTGSKAIELVETWGWDESRCRRTIDLLRARIPDLREGKAGFAPI